MQRFLNDPDDVVDETVRGFVKAQAVAHVHWTTSVESALDEIARAWATHPPA